MKSLFVIPVLAILLLATGCTALGTNGNTANGGNATEVVLTDVTGLAETKVGTPLLPATTTAPVVIPTNARIDAAPFLNALVLSGCEINKAEYKEVTRGGGIIGCHQQGVEHGRLERAERCSRHRDEIIHRVDVCRRQDGNAAA